MHVQALNLLPCVSATDQTTFRRTTSLLSGKKSHRLCCKQEMTGSTTWQFNTTITWLAYRLLQKPHNIFTHTILEAKIHSPCKQLVVAQQLTVKISSKRERGHT